MQLKPKLKELIKLSSPKGIVFLYALFGAFWLIGNNKLSMLLYANSPLSSLLSNLIDLLFIFMTSGILYYLIKRVSATRVTTKSTKMSSRTPYLLAIFISLLLVVPLINYCIIYLYTPKIEQAAYKNLGVISKIKVLQFERWRESRIADVKVLSTDKGFAELVSAFNKTGSLESRQSIGNRIDAIIEAYDYEGASLLSANGKELIRRGIRVASDKVEQELLSEAIKSGTVQFSDLYLVNNNRIQLDLITPISLTKGSKSSTIAFVIIHTGVDRYILPRVMTWPSSSSSAEVLVTKSDAGYENILHLNKNIAKRESAFVRLPLKDNSIYKAAKPLNLGVDYHDKLVFSTREAISNSNWKIITQIDQAEVMAPLRTFLPWISGIALAAVLLVAIILLMLLRQQSRMHQLELQAESGERNRLLRRFYEMPFIGMAVSDPISKLWRQPNQRFCQIFGYSEEELSNMTWEQMTYPEDLAQDQDYYQQFMQGKIDYATWEKRFLHRNGSLIITHIEVNRISRANGGIEAFLVAIEDITVRKKAEAALRESEERLSLVFKGTNDGWWDLDLINNVAYHSPRWWAMLGYGPDQDTIDPTLWQRITHPDDLEPAMRLIRQVLDSDQNSYEVELRLMHHDGHYVPILTRAFILRDEHGNPLRISGANMDLSERKAAEESLRQHEEFNRVLLENLAEGVIACDANMHLAVFNHIAREWHGLDAMKIPADQWNEYFRLYDSEGQIELKHDQTPLTRAFNGEYLQNEAMVIKTHGHEARYVSCSAAPFFDIAGKKLGAVAIMRDITASLRHSEALRKSEALYREMFDANPHPMWVFELKTLAFLAVNDAAIRHYGWSRAEFLSMTIADIHPNESVGRLKNHIPQMIETNINKSGQWQQKKKDGSLIDVELTSHPLDFNGHIASLVLAYDVTEKNYNAKEIQTLNRLLLTLSNINQTIVRRLGPAELFQEACTIAVRDGGFRMAWIGRADSESGQLNVISSAGTTVDYIENLRVDLNDLNKDGPSIQTIRKGTHVLCHDIATDKSFAPWREIALAHGYRSMIALPLRMFGKVIGNFSLYSSESEVFNRRELDLLDEMAKDISFALEVVETEKERQAAAKALQESEALFHTLASASPVGILHTDIKGKPLYANERCLEMSGLTLDQMQPEDWTNATHPEDRKRVQNEWMKAVRAKRGFSMEYRFLRPDGSVLWVQGQAEPERNQNGSLLGFIGTITDITAIKLGEENLRMSAAVFDNTREGIMVTNAENRILLVNRAFTEITHYKTADVMGNKPEILRSGRHDRDFYNEMWQSLKEIGHWQGEIWNRRKDGDIHPVLMSISVIKNDAGEITNYVGVFADISNLKASEAQLEFLAHHDPLTRLPNRLMLISQLGHAIEVARRDKSQLALLMLDLDRFKNVNDSFGHLAGDELLQQVAKRLSERLRGVDTVTRLGGDEFTVLLENIALPEDAARVAENIIATLEAPWKLSNNIEVRIGASVGISLYPGHGTSGLELLQHADAALYQAKAAGRGCARYFSESLTQAARYRFNIEARLRMAIPNNELRIYYQPKIEISSGRVIGVEALVRWQDPVDGLVLPLRFIAIAEETGLIGAIGEWVMREACIQGKQWLDEGMPPLSIAVNISAHQLHHSDIVKTLSVILGETDFPAEYLELELTESILMQREDEIVESLNELRTKGIRLAIDDFGTGYSSLAYLKSFPLDVLKIDRSFVTDIEEDLDDRAITATIIGIAHTLGLKVVAEGVETEQQLEFLHAHKCDMYQGFLVSPPLSAEDFVQFMKTYRTYG